MNKAYLISVITSPKVVYICGVVGGVMMGSGATYLVVNKKLEKKYADIADAEIAEAREMYMKRFKDGEFADLASLGQKYDIEPEIVPEEQLDPRDLQSRSNEMLKQATNIASEAKYVSYDKVRDTPVQTEEERVEVVGSIRKSVWDDRAIVETDTFDPEKEAVKKAQGKPYILDHDTFYENDNQHEQFTLTYFEEDDVLCDEQDRPIPNKDGVVGAGNLRFGYGTEQGNVVLIHNPVIGVDYEITRDKGSYAREILNYEPQERKRPVGRFRDSDD